ncbi:MAG: class I SAM-dependent methyltransferase [Acidobacteria bacterium]|nr:class I SAM-dependent methyltransferase [Acidobacteriota bacterium]
MKQNIYDDPDFFAKYSEMPRSVGGLESAGEWPAFRDLLPDLRGRRVLDLGCGFGWHCRFARSNGAESVIGVDLSAKMLARARAATQDAMIEYQQAAIEDARFKRGQFDIVLSSLAFHYVERFEEICRNVSGWLSNGGSFVFSVEHPIFSSLPEQQWCLDPQGRRLHWPVDRYLEEGIRHTSWMADDVVKYHRTSATYVNTLIQAGLQIVRLVEPAPTEEMLTEKPEWRDECRRPMFLLISAVKRGGSDAA